MDVGTIVEWLVAPGDAITRGQIVAVVDTAKAAIEIEAFENGVIEELLIGTGVQVPVGTPLAIIGASVSGAVAEPGAAGSGDGDRPSTAATRDTQSLPAGTATTSMPRSTPPEHELATPPVRHLAHQLGVDLTSIAGTGPGGHITHDDVVLATPSAPPREVLVSGAARPADEERAPARAVGRAARDRDGGGGGRLRVTPRARRIAAERGVDLADLASPGSAVVTGSVIERTAEAGAARRGRQGGGARQGRAQAGAGAAEGQPTEAAAGAPPGAETPTKAPTPAAAPGGSAADRKAAMRTAIANLMSRANAEIPHYYVSQTMDLQTSLAWLTDHNDDLPAARRVLPAALFLRATALAAVAVPDLNGHWVDGELHPCDHVDLGVAVATRGGGLVTPAIPDAADLRIDDLMAAMLDLVGRARRGKLRQAQMAGASITVSSLGETGPDSLYGVIFPPQVALVGVGGIVERPWAVDGMLTVRPTATITLAADHRASDGRTASAFLATFAHALQNPEEL